jgi:hypothetical protein
MAARFSHLTVQAEETMDAISRFVAFRSLELDRFAVLALACMNGGAIAQTVPGTSNPYLAGMPNASTCCSGDSAPAQSPVQVGSITVTPGATVTFTASGGVDFAGGAPTSGPDGGFVFTTASSDGISGATWPVNALVGVFLDDALPTSTPAPADLDFGPTGIGTGFTTLNPALKQVFFIGDGLTGTGAGTTQTFIVPAGATRLFLGVSDGVGWFNNSGAFNATVTISAPPPPPPPPAVAAVPVPTLSETMLALLTMMLALLVAVRMRDRG